jgi:hypothetical protein
MLPGPSPTRFVRFACEPRRTAAEMASIDATRETARTPTRAAYVGDVAGDGAAAPRTAPPPMPTPSLAERGGGPRARGLPAKPAAEPLPAASATAAATGVVGAVTAPRGNAPDSASSRARRVMSRGERFAGFAGEPCSTDAGPSVSARMASASVLGFLALPARAGDCPLPGQGAVLD